MNTSQINPILIFAYKHKKINMVIAILGFLLMTFYVSFIMEKQYTAQTSILPSQIGGLSSLGGAISAISNIAGLGDQGSNITSQETYIGIINSRQLQDRLLKINFIFWHGKKEYNGNLFKFFEIEATDSTEIFEKAYTELGDVIFTEIDSDNNILTISITMKYPKLTAKVANEIVNILKNIISEKFSYEYQEQYIYIQDRIESVNDSIRHTEKDLRSYLEINKVIDDAKSLIREMQIRRAMAVQTEIYAELLKQKEIFILKNMFHLSPVKVLDEAVTPYKKSRPKRLLLVITFTMLFFFMQIGVIYSIYYYPKLKLYLKTNAID